MHGSCGALLADLQSIRQAAQDLAAGRTLARWFGQMCARSWRQRELCRLPACAQFGAELEAYLEGESSPSSSPTPTIALPVAPCWLTCRPFRQAAQTLPLEEPSPAVWANMQRAVWRRRELSACPACAQFDAELEAYLEGEARPFIGPHAQRVRSVRRPAGGPPSDSASSAGSAAGRTLARGLGQCARAAGGGGSFWRARQRVAPNSLMAALSPRIPLGVLAVLVFVGSALTLPSNSFQRWGGTERKRNHPAVAQTASALPAGEDRRSCPRSF